MSQMISTLRASDIPFARDLRGILSTCVRSTSILTAKKKQILGVLALSKNQESEALSEEVSRFELHFLFLGRVHMSVHLDPSLFAQCPECGCAVRELVTLWIQNSWSRSLILFSWRKEGQGN